MKTIYFITVRYFIPLLCTMYFLQSCDNASTKNDEGKDTQKVYISRDQPLPKQNMVERGRYMVTAGGCNDCHTPKIFGPKGMQPDTSRMLSGHPAETELPSFDPKKIGPGHWVLFAPSLTASVGPWGATFSANLTPDSLTGLGAWKEENFLKLFQNGRHMGMDDGRPIMPPMPWSEIAKMEDEDLKAIFAYLKTIKPVRNKVPAPIPTKELAKISKGGKLPQAPVESAKK